MSIREQIDARLRKARLERDEATRDVIGMIKNKVLTVLKSGGDAEENDELWRAQIAAYAKQLKKAMPEYEKAGDRGVEAMAQAKFELGFCDEFLPKKLDEAATEGLVRKVATENGISAKAQMGKLMGLLMKSHRDEIDGQLARTIAGRVLEG